MDSRHLIDAVVRQTTLLIAQLATSAGLRAPLANVADQVFLDLAQEIEQQGVSRSVAADMFGLALPFLIDELTTSAPWVTLSPRSISLGVDPRFPRYVPLTR